MAVPDMLWAVSNLSLTFPPITAELCLELLRTTHSATGQIAEDHLRTLLPSDAEIANLPLAVIERAFTAQTTIAVALDLAKAVQRLQVRPGPTLNDIVLNRSVQEPVHQLVADMSAWKSGELPWKEVSSSILLYGPPGNGKTLLATALAGSINSPLVATSYSDCQKHGHQGDMLRVLSEKVEDAIRRAPSVFFLDELDSFTHRNAPSRRGDYIVGVVNGLLEHLSRLNNTPGVIVLAATNHLGMIDPAIIRPGRFDRRIEISNPDLASIVRILDQAIGETSQALDLPPIAGQILGASGATIVAIIREAHGLARADKIYLTQSHLQSAANQIAPPRDPDTLWRTAVHETGHMIVATALSLPAPTKAALTMQGGHVEFPVSLIETRETIVSNIAVLLGGYAAESQVFGQASNGAGNGAASDLAIATELAGKMHSEWAMGKKLIHIPFRSALQNHSGNQIENGIESLLRSGLAKASNALEQNASRLHSIATALMSEREFSEERCRDILTKVSTVKGNIMTLT